VGGQKDRDESFVFFGQEGKALWRVLGEKTKYYATLPDFTSKKRKTKLLWGGA